MTRYCWQCGSAHAGNEEICLACGSDLPPLVDADQETIQQQEMPLDISPDTNYISRNQRLQQRYIVQRKPAIRAPLYWILGSIFIPFFIYYYAKKNFEDLQQLNEVFPHRHSPETMHSPKNMLLLFIFFPPLVIYYKFEQLYQHLWRQHNEHPAIPNGKAVIFHTLGGILVIFLGFLAVVFSQLLNIIVASALVTVAFGIHLAYYHFQWQKELNFHILHHRETVLQELPI